ncbi:hypothetical protein DPMN_078435 [Dreissena polymorpha]|uniref:Mcm6 C-terminal winged-helix domain-containing protein n=2 Tax=Dreissena polymorpha TaxID=45954 RepID=A0A9D4BP62_DREPO|nr:hypothetical protein DPMN_078435 [Dreissena polymorpha]
MIRLSEGMARMHCQDEVQPKHVKEAFRLLNKSIIRVEQPDIHLEEEGAEPETVTMETEEAAPPQETPEEAPVDATGAAGKGPKKALKLSYDEYKQMANLLVLYMRKAEEEQEGEDSPGLRRSNLISWYLGEMESEIESEAELLEKKTVIEKVLDRLVHHDHVLIELAQTGLSRKNKRDEDTLVRDDDPFLVVHPNYVVD